jgi:hypothetical protein
LTFGEEYPKFESVRIFQEHIYKLFSMEKI